MLLDFSTNLKHWCEHCEVDITLQLVYVTNIAIRLVLAGMHQVTSRCTVSDLGSGQPWLGLDCIKTKIYDAVKIFVDVVNFINIKCFLLLQSNTLTTF